MKDRIVGIDLGTTNSVPAALRQGRASLIPVRGGLLLPSVVGLSQEGELLVGPPARNQWVNAPERTVRSIKRRMGDGGSVAMGDQEYTPQEISAFLLREMKQAAEAELGESVRRAVITVPAYFNEVQRQATKEAGEIAGFVVERILNEPTAAALAYGYGRDDEHLRILVYDLGGGTFDVSIIELSQGVVDVLATGGDNRLGGDDFDELIAARLADEFRETHEVDLRRDRRAWARLLRAAEEAKITLSDRPVATVGLDYLAEAGDGTPLHLTREVEREEFESLISDLLDRTGEKIEAALEDAGLGVDTIDRVLLVGGSTRIPAVWQLVARRLGQEPHDEVDPDAVVALGAAIQGAIISGEEVSSVLVDVTPLSLGIETARHGWDGSLTADHFSPLVRRNTAIPVRKCERFTTVSPGQTEIHVKVYQGESPVASENTLLGDFEVENLQPDRLDGLADVLVDFELDINGILDVVVTEEGTRRQTRARLTANRQRLSPEEIARSRGRLASAGESVEGAIAQLDPGAAALVGRALEALAVPGIDQDVAAELRDVVDRIEDAAGDGDAEAVQDWCDQLIDLMLDMEV